MPRGYTVFVKRVILVAVFLHLSTFSSELQARVVESQEAVVSSISITDYRIFDRIALPSYLLP